MPCTIDIVFSRNGFDQLKYSRIQRRNIKVREKKERKYSCDQCSYIAINKGNLTRHKESLHEGIRYNCDVCPYKATQPGNLKRHKLAKHEGIRAYNCDQCSYIATRKENLTRHKERQHCGLMIFSNERRLAVPNAEVVELGKELNIPLKMTESTFQVSITWS